MKIEFTLNFAEFLEANQSRIGKASRPFTTGVVAGYVLLALGILAFGLWTGFKHFEKGLPAEQGRSVSKGFVAAGVLLLTGLHLLWQWRRRKDRRLSEAALRDEFEPTQDDVRGFEANEQGWSYRSKHGSDSRPWEVFAGFWDGDAIITLTSKTDLYLLPKRAFTEDELTEFSSLVNKIFQEGVARSLISTQLLPSAWDYTLAEGSLERWQYRPAGLSLLGTALAATTALFIYQLLHWEDFEGGVQTLILSSFCTALILWFFLSPLARLRHYRSQVDRTPCVEAVITSDTIFLRTPKLCQLVKYDSLCRYKETKHTIALFYGDEYFEMLSKRGFDSKQLQTFRDLLSSKIRKR
jgi:hypothetical protein